MNRLFVALLLTLALIVLISPGIVGRLAEKSVEENLGFAASESEEIAVTTESFERGWFTSEGRHRITLKDGSIRALLEDDVDGQIPSLIIETRVDHGLVPVSSVSREAGSLMPGLASTVSTMKLDIGDGQIFDLPAKIYSEVGLTGETTSRLQMDAGSQEIDDAALEWQGADVTVKTSPSTGSIAYEGEIQPLSFQDEEGGVRFGSLLIKGHQDRSAYGFRVGNTLLELDSLTVRTASGPGNAFGRFTFDGGNELEGDRANVSTRLTVSEVPMPTLGELDVTVDVVLNGLDAHSLQQVIEGIRNASTSTDPDEAWANLYPLIEADIQNLLTSGLELRIDQFDVTLPDSELTSTFRFELPDSDTEFSWPALLLALTASADVRIPVKIFEMAEMANPDAAMLIAMGILKKDGDFYKMKAEYAKGLVTVNGAPLPIPLQGL